MKTRPHFSILSLLVITSLLTVAIAEATEAKAKTATQTTKEAVFTGEQLKLKNQMSQLLENSKKVNEPGAAGKNARKKIEAGVNWVAVAQICLGGPKKWNSYSAKNRGKFSSLLKDIISLTAYSRMEDFWEDATYKIARVDVKGKNATVAAAFTADDEDYVLEYFFSKGRRGWQIVDLSFDEDKYSENIREQVFGFLKEKPFSVLLQRLEKRKAALLKPKSTPKKS